MPHTPADSAIRVDKTLEQKINEASSQEEVSALLREAAVNQQLCIRDAYDPTVLLPTELANAAPKRFAAVRVVNGQKFMLESDSEAGLLAEETALYRRIFEQPAVATEPASQLRDEQGRYTSATPSVTADEKAALSLQFQLGQIDAATFIEKSGAINEYLEKQGIPLEELHSAVQERQENRFEQSWASATEEFLKSPAGSTWPGGQENLERAGQLLADNDLANAEDKVAALADVYKFMQENNLIVENSETTAAQRLNEARTPEEIQRALDAYRPNSGSSFFGR